jgi:hypothetical protein
VRNTLSVPDVQTSPAGTARPLPSVLHVSALAPGKKFGSMEEQIVLIGQAFASEGTMPRRYVVRDGRGASHGQGPSPAEGLVGSA